MKRITYIDVIGTSILAASVLAMIKLFAAGNGIYIAHFQF
jgi:hypothetical protein